MKKLFWIVPILMVLLAGPVLAAETVDAKDQEGYTPGLLSFASPSESAAKGTGGGGAVPEGKWRFAITPIAYWSFGIKGPVTILDETRYANASPGDVTNNLSTAGGIGFNFGKGKWTGMANVMYLKWEKENNSVSTSPVVFDTEFEYGVVQLGFGYTLPIARGPKAPNVQLLGFMRASKMKLTVTNISGSLPDADRDVSWTDPFVGFNLVQPVKGNFSYLLNGDVGGFGLSSNQSQLTMDFMTGFGYHWAYDKWGLTLSGGYKVQQLDIRPNDSDLTEEDFSMNVRFQGPTIALTFTW